MKEFSEDYHWSWRYIAIDEDQVIIWQIDGTIINSIYTSHHALYDEDVYVILVTNKQIDGTNTHHVHIWIGTNASEADMTQAERFAASLDVRLRRRATLHWERQHAECEQFLGYFQPALCYLPGKYRYIFRNRTNTTAPPQSEKKMLFAVYLDRNKRKVKQVKCDMSSLNKVDPLILVDIEVVYVLTRGDWNPHILTKIGEEMSFRYTILEPGSGFLPVILLDRDTETEHWDEFYKALGWADLDSFPAMPNGEEEEVHENKGNYQLYEILRNRRGRIYYKSIQFPVPKSVLNTKSLHIITNGKDDICLWIGKKNQDRNKAKLYGLTKLHEFTSRQIPSSKWSPWKHLSIVPEGLESLAFKEHFKYWIE